MFLNYSTILIVYVILLKAKKYRSNNTKYVWLL